MTYILTIDQGTTSCRSMIFDQKGKIVSTAQKELTQIYPRPGWVEHSPQEIWLTQLAMMKDAVLKAGLKYTDISAIGITNQRETTIVWDRVTGEPLGNAIVWQDRRSADICDRLKRIREFPDYVREETGLLIDAYFSATKIRWILDHIPGAQEKADAGALLFGTVDTWLIWHLTGGWAHVTDYSNASRTMLYNIRRLDWDDRILQEMDIPRSMLPEVKDSSGFFEVTDKQIFDGVEIPITGVAGDQQAALFGQACFQPGMAKNTYGTGCFLLKNTGEKIVKSRSGLITTIAWGIHGKIEYALEGSVFIAGAAVQWLRDGLRLIEAPEDSEYYARKVEDAEQVYVVPAFAGLGAPYWDMYARGAIFGLTSGSDKNHIIRATLDAIAYQTKDVLDAMNRDSEISLFKLRVDGGATVNSLLMQFQSDILGVEVQRPDIIESTARGAAFLAGIGAGIWSKDEVAALWNLEKSFHPQMEKPVRDKLYKGWQEAVRRTMDWENQV